MHQTREGTTSIRRDIGRRAPGGGKDAITDVGGDSGLAVGAVLLRAAASVWLQQLDAAR